MPRGASRGPHRIVSRNRDHGEALITISIEWTHAVAGKKLAFGL
jgi:hypothetical protein